MNAKEFLKQHLEKSKIVNNTFVTEVENRPALFDALENCMNDYAKYKYKQSIELFVKENQDSFLDSGDLIKILQE